jgi:hypothetical protein
MLDRTLLFRMEENKNERSIRNAIKYKVGRSLLT